HNGIGEAGDDAVPCREIMCVGLGAERMLREQSAMGHHLFGNLAMGGGIDDIHAAAHDSHRGQSAFHRLSVCMNVDAVRESAYNKRVMRYQVAYEFIDARSSVGGRLTCPDDGDNLRIFKI